MSKLLIAVAGIAGIVIASPLLLFLLSALTGWIAADVLPFLGDWLVSGFGILGVELTRQQLPLLAGTLGFIGAFFKSNSSSK